MSKNWSVERVLDAATTCLAVLLLGTGWMAAFSNPVVDPAASTPLDAHHEMEPRISIITLGVSDLARSVAFYRDGLGLPLQDGADGIAFFDLQGTQLALYPRKALADDATVAPEGTGFPGFTLAHNVRSREAVDAVLEEAAAAGARIVKPAQDASWGGYSGYFADPDGYLWEVAWNPYFDLD